MTESKHVITYPGFAEGLDAKKLFPAIEAANPDYTFHMLPFYEELANGDRVIHSIEKHRDILQNYMDDLDGKIIILVKCGGNRVVTSMDQEHVARVDTFVSFNSPWSSRHQTAEEQKEKLEERFVGWRGIKQADGSWLIPRNEENTSFYIVTSEYMNDAAATDLVDNYRKLASNPSTKLYMIRGLNDEVIPPLRADKVEGAIFIDIEGGDHHLSGESRLKTIGALAAHGILVRASEV